VFDQFYMKNITFAYAYYFYLFILHKCLDKGVI
jgi:hypothetical protein